MQKKITAWRKSRSRKGKVVGNTFHFFKIYRKLAVTQDSEFEAFDLKMTLYQQVWLFI